MKILKAIFWIFLFIGSFGGVIFGRTVSAPSLVGIMASAIIYRCKYKEWIWK